VIDVADARGHLTRAHIRRVDGSGELEVHYNPAQLVIQKSATWTATPARGAASAPNPEFVGAQARTIGLTLILDGPSSQRSVAADAQLLQSWCNPTPDSITAGTPQPPLVKLDWAEPALFEAYLATVNVTYQLFDANGVPLRASVDVTLKESPVSARNQNPSSGGPAGHRTHVVDAGETLQSVAYRVYGDPTLWRALARYNRVEDPLRLSAGTRLDLPPPGRVRELAG
jgi:nucleoid-associated protein YgaU